MIKPEDDIERMLADDLHDSMKFGPYPFENVKLRLIDRIPPALKWWFIGCICGAMFTLVVLEMFTNIDLGLVPNG